MIDLATQADADQWNLTAGPTMRQMVHHGFHRLADVGAVRAALGHGPTAALGRVNRLSTSDGGVPKKAIDAAVVTPAGVEGDAQADRKHHGRPCQALCLYSLDVIEALQAEGHPIKPGDAGENITVEGIPWATLRPGDRLTVGDIPVLVSAHAIPCAKNAQWFADGDFNRMLHARHPGWSRLYAIPLTSGTVRPGDQVQVSGEHN